MKSFSTLLLIAFLSINLACNKDGVSEKELIKLEEAKEKWSAKKTPDYAFKFNRGCFCPYLGVIEVRVDADTISTLIDVETGLEATTEINGETVKLLDAYPNDFYTIDELFEILEKAAKEADDMEGSYDAEFGYPLEVMIDYYVDAIDDEVSYNLSGLELRSLQLQKE